MCLYFLTYPNVLFICPNWKWLCYSYIQGGKYTFGLKFEIVLVAIFILVLLNLPYNNSNFLAIVQIFSKIMSSIGKNIRKIRTIKGLSQTAFANLFDLTRASISAYEEGRAEPKMDATLAIAKYFSIPLEELLSHEITVNEFTRFNFQNVIEGSAVSSTTNLPIVSAVNWEQFINEEKTTGFPVISFPNLFLQGEIAFVVNERINSNFHSGTVLLCKKETKVSENGVYLVFEKERASVKNGSAINSVIGKKLYRILQTIQEINSVSSNSVEERLSRLESKVEQLSKQ